MMVILIVVFTCIYDDDVWQTPQLILYERKMLLYFAFFKRTRMLFSAASLQIRSTQIYAYTKRQKLAKHCVHKIVREQKYNTTI